LFFSLTYFLIAHTPIPSTHEHVVPVDACSSCTRKYTTAQRRAEWEQQLLAAKENPIIQYYNVAQEIRDFILSLLPEYTQVSNQIEKTGKAEPETITVSLPFFFVPSTSFPSSSLPSLFLSSFSSRIYSRGRIE
jgi:hypothetical protein